MPCADTVAKKRKRKQPDANRSSKPPSGAKAAMAIAKAPPEPLLNGSNEPHTGALTTPAPTLPVDCSSAEPPRLGAVAAAGPGVPKAASAPPAWALHAGLLLPQRGAARAADARLKGALAAGAGKADDTSDGGRDARDPAYAAPKAGKPRRSGPGRPPKSRLSASSKGAVAGVTKPAAKQRNGLVGSKGNSHPKGKAIKQQTPIEQPAVCSRGRPIADVLAEQKVRMPIILYHICGHQVASKTIRCESR